MARDGSLRLRRRRRFVAPPRHRAGFFSRGSGDASCGKLGVSGGAFPENGRSTWSSCPVDNAYDYIHVQQAERGVSRGDTAEFSTIASFTGGFLNQRSGSAIIYRQLDMRASIEHIG
jgi:hypothetical protein